MRLKDFAAFADEIHIAQAISEINFWVISRQ